MDTYIEPSWINLDLQKKKIPGVLTTKLTLTQKVKVCYLEMLIVPKHYLKKPCTFSLELLLKNCSALSSMRVCLGTPVPTAS